MNRSDLVDRVRDVTGLKRVAAKSAVDATLDAMVSAVADTNDGEVALSGWGRIYSKVRPARKSRNPRTGEVVDVPEKNTVKFRAGKNFKEAVSA